MPRAKTQRIAVRVKRGGKATQSKMNAFAPRRETSCERKRAFGASSSISFYGMLSYAKLSYLYEGWAHLSNLQLRRDAAPELMRMTCLDSRHVDCVCSLVTLSFNWGKVGRQCRAAHVSELSTLQHRTSVTSVSIIPILSVG